MNKILPILSSSSSFIVLIVIIIYVFFINQSIFQLEEAPLEEVPLEEAPLEAPLEEEVIVQEQQKKLPVEEKLQLQEPVQKVGKPILITQPIESNVQLAPMPSECQWSDWSECDKPCGGGWMSRTIKVQGKVCDGPTKMPCNTQECPKPDINQDNTGSPITSNSRFVINDTFCIDAPGGKTDNGTRVQIWKCNETPAQNFGMNWGTKQIIHAPSRKCLDVKEGSSANGAEIVFWDCHDGNNQKWEQVVSGNGSHIAWKSLGKCLDVPQGKFNEGSKLQLWDCNTTNAQNFAPYMSPINNININLGGL